MIPATLSAGWNGARLLEVGAEAQLALHGLRVHGARRDGGNDYALLRRLVAERVHDHVQCRLAGAVLVHHRHLRTFREGARLARDHGDLLLGGLLHVGQEGGNQLGRSQRIDLETVRASA